MRCCQSMLCLLFRTLRFSVAFAAALLASAECPAQKNPELKVDPQLLQGLHWRSIGPAVFGDRVTDVPGFRAIRISSMSRTPLRAFLSPATGGSPSNPSSTIAIPCRSGRLQFLLAIRTLCMWERAKVPAATARRSATECTNQWMADGRGNTWVSSTQSASLALS